MRLFPISSGPARVRLAQAGAALAAAALMAGCGNNYRPVVTPVSTSGPAAQVTSYAVVISAPSPTAAGIATVIDYSGDTVMAIASIAGGIGPKNLVLDELGSTAYTVNSNGTLANIPISTSLQDKSITYSTLSSDAQPVNLMAPSSGLWSTNLTNNVVDIFASSPEAFQRAISVAPTPITIVGSPTLTGQREYAVSQNFTDSTGVACNVSPTTQTSGVVTPIEIATYSTDTTIAVGKCPVYAVQSTDLNRLFVLNRGDDTITVINTKNNALNSCTPFTDPETGRTVYCHPTLPLSTASLTSSNAPVNCDITTNPTCGMPAKAGPVYAEYNAATSTLVVADYDGGTISVIDVSLDAYGNDSTTFGTTYTISVGNNPASVTVLYDGSRAYTANQTDSTVTVANLSSHTVETTLAVVGHPRTVVSTQNSGYSKVYVASPDSPYITIISASPTATDHVDTTVLVEGNVVDVRATTQNGSSGNSNIVSRTPGYGQPCNLPITPVASASETALQVCQDQ